MKLQRQITLWCISVMCLLTSCEKDDTPTKINPADYAKYALATTATYNLVGKVKTAEKIYYYSEWDNANKTVQRKDATSKIIYEFDINGAYTGYTSYYIDNEGSQFKKEYTSTIEYDSIYRTKTQISETYSPYYRIVITDGNTMKYTTAIKYITEYNDKQKIATEIVTYREGNQEVFTPYRKTIYQLNNENRIDYSAEIQIYEKKVRSTEASNQSTEESIYSRKANNIIKKDSKGNIVESYSLYTSNDYNYNRIDTDSFYEQKITYYDGPASNKLTEEITGNANAKLTDNIPKLIKTSDIGLNGKVKTVTDYQYYFNNPALSWDPVTNTVIKGDFDYKIVSQYNLLGIITEKITYQRDSDRKSPDNFVPITSEKYQFDSRLRITEAYTEKFSYNTNGEASTVYKVKKVIIYDDINKKATLSNFESIGDGDYKKNRDSYIYNLKADGSVDNSYREEHVLRSTASGNDPFEEKPSTTNQYINEYDSQKNWLKRYSLNKTRDESGKINTKVTYYYERAIIYY